MKTVSVGQLVTTFVRSPGDVIRVVGEVREIRAVVVDGHGVQRIIEIDTMEAATTNDQRIYWMDRALKAEERVANWESNTAAAMEKPNVS